MPFARAKLDRILGAYLEIVTFNYGGNDDTAPARNLERLFNLEKERHAR